MGKNDRPISPAPDVIPEGSHAWQEYTVRRVMPDGRVIDSDPMSEGSAMTARSFAIFVRPPAARVVVRRRRVSTFASPWEEVEVAEGDDGSPAPAVDVRALDATDVRTAEDLAGPEQHAHTLGVACPVGGCRWPMGDVVEQTLMADLEAAGPLVQWWVPVDDEMKEIIKRRPFQNGSSFVVGQYAGRIAAMGFAETANGPLMLTVPLAGAVTPGDRISVVGPAGQMKVSPPHDPHDSMKGGVSDAAEWATGPHTDADRSQCECDECVAGHA